VSIAVLVITGPVGVGKTTIGGALSERLSESSSPHAFIDVDALRTCYPAPPDDPFHMALGLRNLAAVCANYLAAGAERLILVDIVESQSDRASYTEAIPDAAVQVVRLRASLTTLRQRLELRETGTSLAWHQQRAAELLALMDERRVEDFAIETDDKPVHEIVDEIMSRSGWA
jgi:adenylylsulfate kinase